MNRIKWYGPSIILISTVIVVMLVGPGVVRQIAWAQSEAKIKLIKDGLARNAPLAEMSAAYREVAEAVEPSVVAIQVSARPSAAQRFHLEDPLRGWLFHGPGAPPDDEDQQPDDSSRQKGNFDKYNPPQAYGSGSGWVYDYQGHVITNNHVVKGAEKIEVTFHDGSTRIAKVVGVDANTDVAVLKVEGGDLHPATLAMDPVEQGDIVCAFGSPFHFNFSMSQGIVSAKGRDNLHILGNSGYENFIQTDAAINPGNSGGPLCNIEGQVVGMNSAIATQTGAFNGLGFAIPIDMVKEVADQIIKTGKVVRGFLDIEINELDPDLARTYGFTGKGVLVLDAPEGGPARIAGIRKDDIITKVDGQPVETTNELRLMVADIAPGKKVTVEFFRDGKLQTVDVIAAEFPTQVADASSTREEVPVTPEQKDTELLRKLGFEDLTAFTQELASQVGVPFQPGVLIRSIRPGSEAASKVSEGWVIIEVMKTHVKTVQEFVDALKKADLADGVRVRLIVNEKGPSNGHAYVVVLKLPTDN